MRLARSFTCLARTITMRCGAAPLCTKRTRILPRYMSQAARGPTIGLLGRRMETWQTLVSLSGRREIDLGLPRDAGRRARGTQLRRALHRLPLLPLGLVVVLLFTVFAMRVARGSTRQTSHIFRGGKSFSDSRMSAAASITSLLFRSSASCKLSWATSGNDSSSNDMSWALSFLRVGVEAVGWMRGFFRRNGHIGRVSESGRVGTRLSRTRARERNGAWS